MESGTGDTEKRDIGRRVGHFDGKLHPIDWEAFDAMDEEIAEEFERAAMSIPDVTPDPDETAEEVADGSPSRGQASDQGRS